MSRALRTLMRLHGQEIDACKHRVAEWGAMAAQAQAAINDAHRQMDLEVAAAREDPIALSMLGPYLQSMRAKVHAMQMERAFMLSQEEEARDALAAAFLEEQKVGQLLEAEQERITADAARQEAANLDEFAIVHAARQQGGRN